MSEEFEIRNKVNESGLVNFDLATLLPKGTRKGIDLKDFLFQEMILKEKEFRAQVAAINTDEYSDAYIYIYNSADAIVPLWAYFVLTAKLTDVAKKIVFGNREDLEVILMHNAIQTYDFDDLRDKRVLVKGCSDKEIPENAYVELVEQLKPIVKSLMFGEACSNVPILKN
ncbi:DUF2480 family protein [Chryseobacterium sp. B21-037]|jgi:hypothetical protein|uniref:DUF2480 family protein n=1 Tax=unclassified Chryseobacterium TaxID=2593645 RepID=UPI0015522FB0|nr:MULTISPECIES: DUF2480 family protein [unclassified Chryseobacterium]MDC8105533.1 DUF2480 family protein [Chryseobacterium sp. B21-037]MDQ1806441.1 DUF2480 family protein [Chryseobacterium sp. CKR4-1]WBV54761.1 DUF2480 family protein [Chryseobacterium daecheongense]